MTKEQFKEAERLRAVIAKAEKHQNEMHHRLMMMKATRDQKLYFGPDSGHLEELYIEGMFISTEVFVEMYLVKFGQKIEDLKNQLAAL